MKHLFFSALLALGIASSANAASTPAAQDLLIKFKNPASVTGFAMMAQGSGAHVQNLGVGNWLRVKLDAKQSQQFSVETIRANPDVLAVQPNYKLHLLENYKTNDPAVRAKIADLMKKNQHKAGTLDDPDPFPFPFPGGGSGGGGNGGGGGGGFPGLPGGGSGGVTATTKPAIPEHGSGGSGADPEYAKQWGMNDNGVRNSWNETRGAGMVVGVIDTGVDYTHEDLVDNLWHNPGETGTDGQGHDKSNNGIDDDSNGYIDDIIGWDFVQNDNKPFDIAVDPMQLLMGGGNPGHGTHCAGNIAARADNGKGTVGIAPEAKIMALRFLSEKGEGDTAGAILAINYGVKNGAKVLSNSWGSEGEDPAEAAKNQALRDAITAAQNAGVLFVAAAGNGHSGVGYDNDSDAKPGFPASYTIDNIVSVAAVDATDKLGAFSNWGLKTVHIAAPGVKVFSTTVGGKYSDTVIDMFGIVATWDGTSMAAPHVAGAAALYWAKHPNATYQEVKQALLESSKPIAAMSGKSVSGGKLSVQSLMSR
jgi:thermitase